MPLTQKFLMDLTFCTLIISSLTYYFDQLNIKFNGLDITKTRLKFNSIPTSNFELEGYVIKPTPTEYSSVIALLCIDNHVNYKVCNNFKMYKAEEHESVLIEILNQNSKNTIIVYIYLHPCMDPTEFKDVYLHYVLDI